MANTSIPVNSTARHHLTQESICLFLAGRASAEIAFDDAVMQKLLRYGWVVALHNRESPYGR